MEGFIAKIRRMGFLLIIGVFLILYIAFGAIYLQQGAKQQDLLEQINKLRVVLASPLSTAEKLQADYQAANEALTPLALPDILDLLVTIASESGIEVDPSGNNFVIPVISYSTPLKEQKVGDGKYAVLSIRGIKVQGQYDKVSAFLLDLDSGKTMNTLVLRRVDIGDVEVEYQGEEATRRAEFREVIAAVQNMMTDNGLDVIPAPVDYAGGMATNYMGDDPVTDTEIEGLPDITTGAADKGYTGTGQHPRDGYLLYQHDRINTPEGTTYTTVSYMKTLKTGWYYTVEADGTVRQFDGPDVATAIEYRDYAQSRIETRAVVDIDIYSKLVPANPKGS